MRKHATTRWTMQHTGGPQYLEVRDTDKVLVVEDLLYRQFVFREWLSSSAKIVATPDAAIHEIERETFDVIFLDRDLGFGRFGEDVAEHLAAVKFAGRVIVHSENSFGAQLIEKTLTDAGIKVECVPFSILGVFRVPATKDKSDLCLGDDDSRLQAKGK